MEIRNRYGCLYSASTVSRTCYIYLLLFHIPFLSIGLYLALSKHEQAANVDPNREPTGHSLDPSNTGIIANLE
jgi:hypothetical protein